MLSITLLICASVAAPAMAVEGVVAIRNSEQLFLPSYSHIQGSPFFLRSRRQTSEADMSECRAISARASCSSSYAQNFINTISKCGDQATTTIKSIEFSCQKTKNDEYCGEVFNRAYMINNCSASSCSTNCFNSLRQADCCLNDGSHTYTPYFMACKIPLPSPCANSHLQIPAITQEMSCTSTREYGLTALVAGCDNVQPIFNALSRDDTCKPFSDALKDLCNSRNGQYCFLALNTTGSDGDSVGLRSLHAAASVCSSVSACSSQCSSSLNVVKNTVGCCIHTINSSVISFSEFHNISDSSLWKQCGIPFPRHCSSAFINVINTFIVFSLVIIIFFILFD